MPKSKWKLSGFPHQVNLSLFGIDQTGATDKKGNPRPLPACWIRKNEITFLYLPSLAKKTILDAINANTGRESGEKGALNNGSDEAQKTFELSKRKVPILVCLDCVIGLPASLGIEWRTAVEMTASQIGFGRRPAQEFFSGLSSHQGQFPRRSCELRLKANSVFQIYPFQKNIQTGTYRIWKDIAQNSRDFYAPVVESSPSSSIPIFEGYPSHSWKKIFGKNIRDPKSLTELMRVRFPALDWDESHQIKVDKDPNLADALVLALTLFELVNDPWFFESVEDCFQELAQSEGPTFKQEGFILSELL